MDNEPDNLETGESPKLELDFNDMTTLEDWAEENGFSADLSIPDIGEEL